MSLGNVYYVPKNAARFNSVAKFVKAGNNNKKCLRMFERSGHVHFT